MRMASGLCPVPDRIACLRHSGVVRMCIGLSGNGLCGMAVRHVYSFAFQSGMGIHTSTREGGGPHCNPVHMQCRGSRRAFHAAGKKAGGFMFHGGSQHERGPGTDIFLWSHMHYVGRSFRLLNPLTSVPAPSERFSGRKFHHAEIFCRKPKGKRGVPQGRANFDEGGGNFSQYGKFIW